MKKLVSERSAVVAVRKALAKARTEKMSKEQGQRGVSSEWVDVTALTVLRGADSGGMECELTLEILEQISYRISLVVQQERLVVGVPGGATSAATADITHSLERPTSLLRVEAFGVPRFDSGVR